MKTLNSQTRFVFTALLCIAFVLHGSIAASAQEKTNPIFIKAQIAAQFPGGKAAWQKYLSRNLSADALAKKGAPPGTYRVDVTFIVDKEGNLLEVKALNDPGYGAKEAAEHLLKKGPKWVPAVQNGQKVIYRHKQDITFRVMES